MPTQLAKRIQQELDKGKSIRGLGRDMGLSNSTVRKMIAGELVDHKTLVKVAAYFGLPIDAVYRLAEMLSPTLPALESLPAEEQFVIQQIILNYTRMNREGKQRLAEFILWLPMLTPENQAIVVDLMRDLHRKQSTTET